MLTPLDLYCRRNYSGINFSVLTSEQKLISTTQNLLHNVKELPIYKMDLLVVIASYIVNTYMYHREAI